ncbi:TonB-dependent receptor, partial [Enterobacter hormaechei subsp. steigerwaltii]|nr:TonB-dependent receptor [Enterobacter hormaechei subsp. steigerwaltii]
VEGMINSDKYDTSRLESYRSTGELNMPFFWLVEQTLTVGAEWNRDELNDPASMQATNVSGEVINGVPGTASERNSKNSADLTGIYLEDNIEARQGTNLIPGLRFDYH